MELQELMGMTAPGRAVDLVGLPWRPAGGGEHFVAADGAIARPRGDHPGADALATDPRGGRWYRMQGRWIVRRAAGSVACPALVLGRFGAGAGHRRADVAQRGGCGEVLPLEEGTASVGRQAARPVRVLAQRPHPHR